MSKRTEENIVAIVIFLILVTFLVVSYQYGERARMVPVPVAIASLVFIVIQFVLQNSKTNIDLNVNAADLFRSTKSGQVVEEEKIKTIKATVKKKNDGGPEWVAYGLLGALIMLILLIGVMPAMFVFVLGYLILISKSKWYIAAIYSSINTLVLYALFVLLLEREMYEGILMSLLQR